MKILFFSDLHEHNYQEFSELKDGLNSRMLDGLVALHDIEEDAKASKVDVICFGGDVFHLKNFVDSQVIWHTIKAFESLAKVAPIYICAGNHDYKNWGKDPVLVEALSGLVANVNFEEVVGLPFGWNLFVFNYKRNLDELQALLNHWKSDDHSIGLFHQDVIGSRYGGIEVMKGLDAKQLSEKFRWSFVGHYHTPRQYAPNVFSIGAPLAHNFSDIGEEHGWWILDTDKEQAQFRASGTAPRFIDIELDGKELAEFPECGRSDVDFFRIRSHSHDLPESIRNLKWKRVSFISETDKKERGNLKFSDNIETLVSKYVAARNTELDPERLIEMGKKYLGW